MIWMMPSFSHWRKMIMNDDYVEELVEMEDGDELLETQESENVESMVGIGIALPMDEVFLSAIWSPDYHIVGRDLSVWARRKDRDYNTELFLAEMRAFLTEYPEVTGIHLPYEDYIELADVYDIALRKSPVPITRGEHGEDLRFDTEKN